jgi:hypothetical protein
MMGDNNVWRSKRRKSPIVVEGNTMRELWEKCIRKEAEGYECVKPMEKVYKTQSNFVRTRDKIGNAFKYQGVIESVKYRCVYEYKGDNHG